MKFIDTTRLSVKAGDGGDGCASFRREKFVPRGGPDGGNGGRGGNIVIVGTRNKQTLLDFRHNSFYKAERGEHGRGKTMHGAGGKDMVLEVPLGTIIRDEDTGKIIADVTTEDTRVIVAQGGRGGRGNTAFVTPMQRAPREREFGHEGEGRNLVLELKLIADIGIIGFPNAGKSTFISVVSAARPKIADYPFTTLTPNLGVVKGQYAKPYVIADMPGLIEGAHEGAGLGHRFLRHIERTKLLAHFIDASDERPMLERYDAIRKELELYESRVHLKQEIIVATKMDSVNEVSLAEFEAEMVERGIPIFKISALTKDGLQELLLELETRVDQIDASGEPDYPEDDEFDDDDYAEEIHDGLDEEFADDDDDDDDEEFDDDEDGMEVEYIYEDIDDEDEER